jgi:hypothetical protein
MMSGDVPYKVSIAKMIKEIETKKRPPVEKYSLRLNSLVDKMLTIEVSKRITVDEILEALSD